MAWGSVPEEVYDELERTYSKLERVREQRNELVGQLHALKQILREVEAERDALRATVAQQIGAAP